jgi:hypothetical protein
MALVSRMASRSDPKAISLQDSRKAAGETSAGGREFRGRINAIAWAAT